MKGLFLANQPEEEESVTEQVTKEELETVKDASEKAHLREPKVAPSRPATVPEVR